MSKKNQENYLDYIPIRNSAYQWNKNSDGIVVVDVVNNGFFNWLAQKLFKRPRVSHIKLDAIGSYNWELMDGVRTIYDISEKVRSEFGDKAEPLYERQIKFYQILKNHKFASLNKKQS